MIKESLKDFLVEKKDFTPQYGENIEKGALIGDDFYAPEPTDGVRRWRKSVLLLGDPNSKEVLSYKKANIAEMNASYLIADRNGSLLRSMGSMLKNNGYIVQVLNLSDTNNSHIYNPISNVFFDDTDNAYRLAHCLFDLHTYEKLWDKFSEAEMADGFGRLRVTLIDVTDVFLFMIYFATETIPGCTLGDVACLISLCHVEPDKMFGENGVFSQQKKITPELKCFVDGDLYMRLAGMSVAQRTTVISMLNVVMQPYLKESNIYNKKNEGSSQENEIVLSRMMHTKMALFVIPSKKSDNGLMKILLNQADCIFSETNPGCRRVCMMIDDSICSRADVIHSTGDYELFYIASSINGKGRRNDIRLNIDMFEYAIFIGGPKEEDLGYYKKLVTRMGYVETDLVSLRYKPKEWVNDKKEVVYPEREFEQYISEIDENTSIIVSNDYDRAIVCPTVDFEKHRMYAESGDASKDNEYDYTKYLDEHIEYRPDPVPRRKIKLEWLCEFLECEPDEVAERVLEILSNG